MRIIKSLIDAFRLGGGERIVLEEVKKERVIEISLPELISLVDKVGINWEIGYSLMDGSIHALSTRIETKTGYLDITMIPEYIDVLSFNNGTFDYTKIEGKSAENFYKRIYSRVEMHEMLEKEWERRNPKTLKERIDGEKRFLNSLRK